MRLTAQSLLLVPAAVFSLLLTGCSTSFDQTEVSPSQGDIGTIHGYIHGGQAGVVGAHVYVMGTSKTAYGGNGIAASTSNASTSLLTGTGNSDSIGSYVLAGSGGSFTVTGDYTCNLGQVVYIYAAGGNPGLANGTNNTAIGEMAILGPCPSNGGNLASTAPSVFVDEVSTIAAAYSLAGFATDSTHIGMSGSTLATTGINNAAATAGNIVTLSTGAASATPLTTGAAGTAPQALINSLANIIGSCINTSSSTSTQCTTLFRNATSDGVQCASTCTDEPADTATAAINMAHYPGQNSSTATNNNVYNLYALQSGFSLFTPQLTAQPPDFSMQISFTGGGIHANYTGRYMTIDGAGNIYVANGQGATVNSAGTSISKFSNLGVPANASGYTSLGVSTPDGLAVNAASTDVWIASYDNDKMVDFNIANGTGTTYSLATGTGPGYNAIDSSGNIWNAAANDPDNTGAPSTVFKMTTGGTVTYYKSTNGLGDPYAIAVTSGANGYVWVTNASGNDSISLFGLGTSSNKTIVSSHPGQGPDINIDASGNAWVATSSDIPAVWYMAAGGGTPTGYSLVNDVGSYIYDSALDGAGNIWVAGNNFGGYLGTTPAVVHNNYDRIWAISNTGTSLTGIQALTPEPQPANPTTTEGTDPDAILVDGSGNVWYNSISDATLHEIIGAAVPVVTPIAAGVVNGTLATRP